MRGLLLNDLIEAALRGERYNQDRLGREARRYCDAIMRGRCADMPEDLLDEIFQQSFVELFAAGPGALAKKSGKKLFRAMIFNAIRIVRADYAPPGTRTRSAPKGAPPQKVAAEDIGHAVSRAEVARCTVISETGPYIDFDRFESRAASSEIQQIEDRLDGERLLRDAPAGVAAMLRLICIDGERVDDTAESFGIGRFQYYRAVKDFRASLFAA